MINFADEPTMKDYLASIRRHVWIPAVTLLLALLVGVWQAYLVKPTYRASALVLADTATTDTRDYVDKITVPEVARVMETLGSQVLTTEKLEALIAEMKLYPDDSAIATKEEVAAKMRKAITTEVVGFDTFQVSFAYRDAATAAAVANRLAQGYLDAVITDRRRNGEKTNSLLNEQIARVAATLKKQDAAMKQYKIDNMGALPGQTEGNIRAIERWQTDLRMNTEDLVRARETLDLALASTPKIFQDATVDKLKADVQAKEAERKAILAQINREEKLVARAGEVEGHLAGLQSQYNTDLATYNDLMKRRQEVSIRVGLDLDRLESLFRVIEPARPPLMPFRPIRPLVMGAALAIGLLLGTLLAIARDYFDETFDDPATLAKHAALPVLAAVPRVRAPAAAAAPTGLLHH